MRISFLSLFLAILFSLTTACSSDNQTESDAANSGETADLLIEGEEPEVISGPHQFTEGPYWHPEGYLLFSDIPANRVYRWSGENGTEVFLEPSGNSNGIQADLDGSVLLAQHRGSLGRISDGSDQFEIVIDTFEGQRFNSPNDLAVHSNGTIFFTDPPFGVSDEDRELDFSGVFMLTPDGELSVLYDEFNYPNGIVFNADETVLYLNDSETGAIIAFEVDEAGMPHSPREFANVGAMGAGVGAADGMITDMQGNLYVTGPPGLTIFDQNGEELHIIEFDEQITNLEWGGENADQLFITARDYVYRFRMNTTGTKKR
ncbi:MAG: SMP-30/gluconolactonase/LRE family protein [Balneolia bacterium]|nr:SMP-30/gluconolactonase/LRE family protein [Balneolia bacterium]